MTASARKFSAPEAKVFRPGPFGIPLHGTCAICGDGFEQPSNGRPRILCRKPECGEERNKQKRQARESEAPMAYPFGWTDADLQEALELWGGCSCGAGELPYRFHWEFPPLPRCQLCWAATMTRAQALWQMDCKRGCPLPNPRRFK